MRRAIRAPPERFWHPALEQGGTLRAGAEVAELTGMVDLAGHSPGTHIIVRRERPEPGADEDRGAVAVGEPAPRFPQRMAAVRQRGLPVRRDHTGRFWIAPVDNPGIGYLYVDRLIGVRA